MRLDGIDPFRLFGLSTDASLDDIRRRYRELALAYHPDRRGGNDRLQTQKFATVCAAYEAILQARQAAERNQTYGLCASCGALKALTPRLDGTRVCVDCLVRPRQVRLLPGPPLLLIRCTFSAICLVASAVCLVLQLSTGSVVYGLAACAIGVAGLIVVGLLGLLFPVTPAEELRRIQELRSGRSKRQRPALRR